MNPLRFIFSSYVRIKSDMQQCGWECAETLHRDRIDTGTFRYRVRFYRDDWHGKETRRICFKGQAKSISRQRKAICRAARKALHAWKKYPEIHDDAGH